MAPVIPGRCQREGSRAQADLLEVVEGGTFPRGGPGAREVKGESFWKRAGHPLEAGEMPLILRPHYSEPKPWCAGLFSLGSRASGEHRQGQERNRAQCKALQRQGKGWLEIFQEGAEGPLPKEMTPRPRV